MSTQDLRDADAAWLEALLARDGAAASTILHDEYALILVHPQPARVERDEWLRTLAGYVITSWSVRGSAWDVRPDLAVHLQLVEMRATVFRRRPERTVRHERHLVARRRRHLAGLAAALHAHVGRRGAPVLNLDPRSP